MAYNEQLVLYDYERDFCKRIAPVLRALGAKRIYDNPKRVGREAAQPHQWLLGWKDGNSDWRKKTVRSTSTATPIETSIERTRTRLFKTLASVG